MFSSDVIDDKISKIVASFTRKKELNKMPIRTELPSSIGLFYGNCRDSLVNALKNKNIFYRGDENYIDILGNNLYCGIAFTAKGYDEVANTLQSLKQPEQKSTKMWKIISDVKKLIGHQFVERGVFDLFHSAVNGNNITFYDLNIKCNQYVLKDKVLQLPENYQVIVKSIVVCTDDYAHIQSVKLDNKHPNADRKMFYCLGDDQHKPLTIETLKKIISRISVFNLNDCYYNPFTKDGSCI